MSRSGVHVLPSRDKAPQKSGKPYILAGREPSYQAHAHARTCTSGSKLFGEKPPCSPGRLPPAEQVQARACSAERQPPTQKGQACTCLPSGCLPLIGYKKFAFAPRQAAFSPSRYLLRRKQPCCQEYAWCTGGPSRPVDTIVYTCLSMIPLYLHWDLRNRTAKE